MGVTRQDLFGGGRRDAALPGTYGEAPAGSRLPATTRVGAVVLQIGDLARSVRFYQDVLGLRTIRVDEGETVLGAEDGVALVVLRERRGARPNGRSSRLGLYHFAILLPDRVALGRFIRHVADVGVRIGAADHLVSEATYLTDPDGLGIEVYADRARETWTRSGRELVMATDPLDLDDLVRAGGTAAWTGMPAGTRMGHVHLHVGDLERSAAFYGEALGFDRMVWSYPGALFLAAGGYHHHLGINTWAGAHADVPTEEDARLIEWTVELPDVAAVAAAAERLERAGQAVDRTFGGAVRAHDPWGTGLVLLPTPP